MVVVRSRQQRLGGRHEGLRRHWVDGAEGDSQRVGLHVHLHLGQTAHGDLLPPRGQRARAQGRRAVQHVPRLVGHARGVRELEGLRETDQHCLGHHWHCGREHFHGLLPRGHQLLPVRGEVRTRRRDSPGEQG